MPKQITNMTKERLKEAVHDMAIMTDEGMHPTSALVKVAKSLDLTADQTRLVGRAYNTAHTADVREQGTSILEKLATTPIADCEGAVEQLEQEKTASEDDVASVYAYDRSPSELQGLFQKAASDRELQEFVKEASVKKPEVVKEFSLRKLMSDQQYLEGQLKKYAGVAENLKDELNAALQVMHKRAMQLTPEKRLATKLAVVNRLGKEILLYIDEAIPTTEKTTKIASCDVDLDGLVDVVYLIGQRLKVAMYTLDKVAKCKKRVDVAVKKKCGNPGDVKTAAVGLSNTIVGAGMIGNALRAANLDKALLDGVGDNSASDVDLQSRFIRHGVMTPDHQQSVDAIRLKSMMNDMMSNDDIISEHDPDEVFRVFNELNATAPDAMSRPMIARSFLREALAKGGVLGSYDINPLMSYDKDIASQAMSKIKDLELAPAPKSQIDRKAAIKHIQ